MSHFQLHTLCLKIKNGRKDLTDADRKPGPLLALFYILRLQVISGALCVSMSEAWLDLFLLAGGTKGVRTGLFPRAVRRTQQESDLESGRILKVGCVSSFFGRMTKPDTARSLLDLVRERIHSP